MNKIFDDWKGSGTIGRWLPDGDRQLGLVFQRQQDASYFIYYDDVKGMNMPLLAISLTEGGKVAVQKRVPGSKSEVTTKEYDPKVFMDLFDALLS